MALPSRGAVPTALALSLACGPQAGSEDDGGGDGDASTADDDDTGAQSCEMYEPAPDIGPAVAMKIFHEGSAPVFFVPVGCGGAFAFEITRGGEPVPYLLDSECSPNTCDGFIASSDCSVGCNDCAPPNAGRIDVGAVGDGTWPGRTLTELALLAACAPTNGCPATCVRPDQAEPGTYEITLTVYRTCMGTCECDGPSTGVCGLWSGEELTDPVTISATIDYPAQITADLVITD